jgi:hypothetical protein
MDPLFLNPNIKHIIGNYEETLDILSEIDFIFLNINSYFDLKKVFDLLIPKLLPGSIIIFNKLVSYNNYVTNGLKLLYEYLCNDHFSFEWLFTNCKFEKNGLEFEKVQIAIKIIKINNLIYNNNNIIEEERIMEDEFNWNFYINYYKDLNHITNKKEAFLHWSMFGKKEGRICNDNNNNESLKLNDIFDWEIYIELNPDLKLLSKEEAINHWNKFGTMENRLYYFDWFNYIKYYNLLPKLIDTKIKAVRHWNDNGRPLVNKIIDYNLELFDWKFYVNNYDDLKDLTNHKNALNHWLNFGQKEGRISNNFKWLNYLLLNKDLIESGINSESQATEHYIKHGKKEKRKII